MKKINRVLGLFFYLISVPIVAGQLIDIKKIEPTIIIDLKYATPDNFTGQTIYTSNVCFLHKDTAHALSQVQKELHSMKLSLKIWDGYRSLAAQQKLWDVCAARYPDEKEREQYVSNPKKKAGIRAVRPLM